MDASEVGLEAGLLPHDRRQLRGGVVAEHVVEVDHRRLDVSVAHVGLHVRERECLDGERPERVPQVVKDERIRLGAQLAEAGCLERVVEAPAQARIVERLAYDRREDEIVIAVRSVPLIDQAAVVKCSRWLSASSGRPVRRAFRDGPARTRTWDRRIMSPLL